MASASWLMLTDPPLAPVPDGGALLPALSPGVPPLVVPEASTVVPVAPDVHDCTAWPVSAADGALASNPGAPPTPTTSRAAWRATSPTPAEPPTGRSPTTPP